MNDLEPPDASRLGPVGFTIVMIITAWVLYQTHQIRKDLFKQCMNERHDEVLCHIYARTR